MISQEGALGRALALGRSMVVASMKGYLYPGSTLSNPWLQPCWVPTMVPAVSNNPSPIPHRFVSFLEGPCTTWCLILDMFLSHNQPFIPYADLLQNPVHPTAPLPRYMHLVSLGPVQVFSFHSRTYPPLIITLLCFPLHRINSWPWTTLSLTVQGRPDREHPITPKEPHSAPGPSSSLVLIVGFANWLKEQPVWGWVWKIPQTPVFTGTPSNCFGGSGNAQADGKLMYS